MRENLGTQSPGPGAFSLEVSLHDVPAVQRQPPTAKFGARVYHAHPRLHLVDSTVR